MVEYAIRLRPDEPRYGVEKIEIKTHGPANNGENEQNQNQNQANKTFTEITPDSLKLLQADLMHESGWAVTSEKGYKLVVTVNVEAQSPPQTRGAPVTPLRSSSRGHMRPTPSASQQAGGVESNETRNNVLAQRPASPSRKYASPAKVRPLGGSLANNLASTPGNSRRGGPMASPARMARPIVAPSSMTPSMAKKKIDTSSPPADAVKGKANKPTSTRNVPPTTSAVMPPLLQLLPLLLLPS